MGERTSRTVWALWVLALYGVGVAGIFFGLSRKRETQVASVHPLARALSRGFVAHHVPRLSKDDAFANAAILNALLDEATGPTNDKGCAKNARLVAVMLSGRLSRVRFSGRQVCKLQRLKEVSVRQENLESESVAEVAAFLVGKRLGDDVDVTRIVVPPFRFSGDTLDFVAAEAGPLGPGEQFLGTYHTHPGNELEQGVLSETDLLFLVTGRVRFAGQGDDPAAQAALKTSWLVDIVEPRHGDWNVFAHDSRRLSALLARCQSGPICPLNELRLGGSDFHLGVRFYEEPSMTSAP